jgi:hypothetical protein
MDNWQLPSDLQRLECELGSRSLPSASAQLRQRVLDDLRTSLRAERSRANWRFAAAVAATMLVWMNFSMSATQATDFGFRRNAGLTETATTESIESTAEQICQLAPEFSLEDARREAILMQAGATIVPLPDVTDVRGVRNAAGTGPFFGRHAFSASETPTENMDLSPSVRTNTN